MGNKKVAAVSLLTPNEVWVLTERGGLSWELAAHEAGHIFTIWGRKSDEGPGVKHGYQKSKKFYRAYLKDQAVYLEVEILKDIFPDDYRAILGNEVHKLKLSVTALDENGELDPNNEKTFCLEVAHPDNRAIVKLYEWNAILRRIQLYLEYVAAK